MKAPRARPTRMKGVHTFWIILLVHQKRYSCLDKNATTDAVPVAEQDLYRRLMSSYEKTVRPVMNFSDTITVNFGLMLNHIIDLNGKTQVLSTDIDINQEWRDEYLTWPEAEYPSVKSLRLPAADVWTPDTFIYNNENAEKGFMWSTYVLVNASGSILWRVPIKLRSTCFVDITYFPFDYQKCPLRFGSWIYSSRLVTFQSSGVIQMGRKSDVNSEWEVIDINITQGDRFDATFAESHPDLTFTLHMKRRGIYYIYNIITPCIMLSCLTLVMFLLPVTSGEKVTLGLSVFLAFSMFMLMIAEQVPATSNAVPLIGVYLTVVMSMTSVSVATSVFVINLFNTGVKASPAPRWLHFLVLKLLAKALCMNLDVGAASNIMNNHRKRRDRRASKWTSHNVKSDQLPTKIDKESQKLDEAASIFTGDPVSEELNRSSCSCCTAEPVWLRRSEYKTKVPNVKVDYKPRPTTSRHLSIHQPLSEQYRDVDCLVEWRLIAIVLDRLLLLLFLVGTLAAYTIVLVIQPGNQSAS